MKHLDVKQIEEIIPHRHPFLLVDYIEDYEPGEFAVGYKCVTFREDFFRGHFPQEPVMPGVLMVEALAQVGAVAILSLITGLCSKEVSVDYICKNIHADGIISTKASMINRAKKLGMYTVLRFFLIDSMAIKNIENLGNQHEQLPDVVEVLPGVMPKILKQICKTSKVPVIAGGLISDKEDVMGALGAGAAAVSTTNQKVWEL